MWVFRIFPFVCTRINEEEDALQLQQICRLIKAVLYFLPVLAFKALWHYGWRDHDWLSPDFSSEATMSLTFEVVSENIGWIVIKDIHGL